MLKKRVVTAVVAGLVVLFGILWGEFPWHLLVWVGTLAGTMEYCTMLGFSRFDVLTIWTMIVVSVFLWWFPLHLAVIVPVVMAVAMMWPVMTKNRVTVVKSSAAAVGAFYLGYGGVSLAYIRTGSHGIAWIFLLLISIWMTDTVAFFAGKAFGGPKLWPTISPAKTISGALFGVAGGAVGAIVWGFIAFPGFHPLGFAWLGAVISVAGQMGDLVESAYKRSAGVKDSGNILPGHGGLLDRVDSLFFSAPVLYFLLGAGYLTWFR